MTARLSTISWLPPSLALSHNPTPSAPNFMLNVKPCYSARNLDAGFVIHPTLEKWPRYKQPDRFRRRRYRSQGLRGSWRLMRQELASTASISDRAFSSRSKQWRTIAALPFPVRSSISCFFGLKWKLKLFKLTELVKKKIFKINWK